MSKQLPIEELEKIAEMTERVARRARHSRGRWILVDASEMKVIRASRASTDVRLLRMSLQRYGPGRRGSLKYHARKVDSVLMAVFADANVQPLEGVSL